MRYSDINHYIYRKAFMPVTNKRRGRQPKFREFIFEGKKYRLPRCSHIVSTVEDFKNSEYGKAWLERTGEKEAKEINQRACKTGTFVHKAIELFYENPTEYITYASKLDTYSKQFLNNYSTFLQNQKPILAEVDVAYFDPIKKIGVVGKPDSYSQLNIRNFYYDKEFRNRADIDDFALLDFKNKSKSISQVHYLTGYLIQLALYTIMIKQTFPHLKPINQVMVVVSSPRAFNMFYANEDKLKQYQEWALKILEAFWKKQKFDLEDMKKHWGYLGWNEKWNRPDYAKDNIYPIKLFVKPELEF